MAAKRAKNPVGFARVDATELWQTLDTNILLHATYRIMFFIIPIYFCYYY